MPETPEQRVRRILVNAEIEDIKIEEEKKKGRAVDDDGNYCGKSVETGELVPPDPGKLGYCGPNCYHCVHFKHYTVQNGVWVCGADWEPGV